MMPPTVDSVYNSVHKIGRIQKYFYQTIDILEDSKYNKVTNKSIKH